jgi:glucose/arabinose dehydrogenase
MPLRPAALTASFAALAALAVFASPASAALHLTQVETGFSSPVHVTAPPGDPHRLMVVERAGKIIEIVDGQKQAAPFLDITTSVRSGGEQGLLSMAFAPDYGTSGRYYIYYTAPRDMDAGGSVLTVDEISPSGRRNIYTVDHPSAGNHNGGQLQFGPDGLLYAATGDGASTPAMAQDLNSRLGKVLRVNPLSPNAASPEIYAYGLRNPFRFSFDRQTGDLIIGDVGAGSREEVDFSAAGTASGVNYGWPCREGSATGPGGCTATGNVVDPVLEKNHTSPNSGGDGYCAIIGGFVSRGPTLPELDGRYVYGDNCNTGVRSVSLPAAGDDASTGLDVPGLSSFGEDSCGHLYATSLSGGQLYRIDGDTFTPCPEPPPPGTNPPPGTGGPGGSPNPPGGGNGDPGTTPPGDTRAPVVRIGSLRRQPVLRLRGFRLSVRCDELCGATITGTVRVKESKRVYVLTRATRQIAAGKRVKLTLRASRRLRRAIRRGGRATATLAVVARDAAGNAATAKRRVRAVR